MFKIKAVLFIVVLLSLSALGYASQPSPVTIPVYGHVYNPDGTPLESATVTARLEQKSTYKDEIELTTEEVSTTTDIDGYWELQLIETTNMSPAGSKYVITVTGTDYSREYRVLLPDTAASYKIQDLL